MRRDICDDRAKLVGTLPPKRCRRSSREGAPLTVVVEVSRADLLAQSVAHATSRAQRRTSEVQLAQKTSEQLALVRTMIEWSHTRELFVQLEAGTYHSMLATLHVERTLKARVASRPLKTCSDASASKGTFGSYRTPCEPSVCTVPPPARAASTWRAAPSAVALRKA